MEVRSRWRSGVDAEVWSWGGGPELRWRSGVGVEEWRKAEKRRSGGVEESREAEERRSVTESKV